MSKRYALTLAVVTICTALSGCGKQTVQETVDSAQAETAQEETVQSVSGGDAANRTDAISKYKASKNASEEVSKEASEDYVYDYQVSTEPIPKEIADLGGPCQGTVHAFPSKIQIGLAQKIMEEDAELKEEVEKRIPEVEQYLKENIGGEFRVDEANAGNDFIWSFLCTEIDTGYTFEMSYFNWEFAYRRNIDVSGGNEIPENQMLLSHYYDGIETEKVEQAYAEIIEDCFDECVYKIWFQSIADVVMLNIFQFTDEEVDKTDEQIKILNLWYALNDYDDEVWYTINLMYFPSTYYDVIEQKCSEGIFSDLYMVDEAQLLKNGELKAYFSYWDSSDGENYDNLSTQYILYRLGKYNEDAIWSYWIEAE